MGIFYYWNDYMCDISNSGIQGLLNQYKKQNGTGFQLY